MLDSKKRNRLLAGVLATVMLVSTAGCISDEEDDKEWQNDNTQQQEQHHSSIWPWFFLGRLSGAAMGSPAVAPNSNDVNKTENKKDGISKNSVEKKSTETKTSRIGSIGSEGKSGIGSGKIRSSGSAVS